MKQTERRFDGSTVEIGDSDPAPIEDAPAVCVTCSELGASPHQCDAPAECPCTSARCGEVVPDGSD